MIRLLIVDDSALMRNYISRIIESGIESLVGFDGRFVRFADGD